MGPKIVEGVLLFLPDPIRALLTLHLNVPPLIAYLDSENSVQSHGIRFVAFNKFLQNGLRAFGQVLLLLRLQWECGQKEQ